MLIGGMVHHQIHHLLLARRQVIEALAELVGLCAVAPGRKIGLDRGLHRVQQDLFLDGLWLRSLTNIPPTRSNLVNVVINGHSVNYSVPLSATIRSVASGLTG